MADLAQLERALRNADAAGDAEAARMLAQAIRAERPAQSAGSRFAAGLIDPIQGGAQMLESAVRAIAPGAVDAINRVNNRLADFGIVGRLPAGGVAEQTRQREQALKTSDIDWPRLAGNVLSPVNAAIAARAPVAATAAGRIAAGAGLGAVSGGLMPSAGDDARLSQMSAGAVGGALVPAVAAGVGRVISPAASTNPQMTALRAEGINPTIGQALGGVPNKIEQKAISLPFVGDAISSARLRAAADMNSAVANRALQPIGEKAPSGLVGRELVSHVQGKLSDAYNALLPKLTVQADQVFAQEVQTLRSMVANGSIDPNAAKTFQRILQNDVLGKFKGQQALTGQTMKAIESDLGQKIAQFGGSTDADARLVADALREVQSSLRSLVQRSNPAQAAELRAINTGWANFKRLERAASYVGADDGLFSASQLQSAVKALDRSKDKGRFARGDALMQDLSDPAKSILGANVPNSGTADRLMQAGAIGSGLVNPAIPLGLLAGAAAYSSPVQRALVSAVSSRPQAAQPIAGLLNQSAPMLAPAGGLLLLDAMK